jgi:alkylation response protein AidB-like acyl-CoA dehydrogenase
MDVRLSAEQQALRDAAAQAADRLGPKAVADLGDGSRAATLDAAVSSAGWRELRAAGEGGGAPLASAVEAAVVAEEFGRALADVAFLGPTLAADLRRLSGAAPAQGAETVAFAPDLSVPALAAGGVVPVAVAVDAAGAAHALVLVPGPDGALPARVARGRDEPPLDLTRPTWVTNPASSAAPLEGGAPLGEEALARWRALGLALTCADLVGVMRGALGLACAYVRERRQYDAPVGSFQAVQHLLADAHVAMEGSRSAALHAAWAVDALGGSEADAAAALAKAYCARAARDVCEAVIQVHGGIGNTWDCLAHVYLRRALLSADLLGGVGPNLERVLVQCGIGEV